MDCTKIKQTYYDICEPNNEIMEHLDRPLQCVDIIKDYVACTNSHIHNMDKEDT